MIVRLLLFVCIGIIAIVAPTPLLALCALAYALRYTAYELIVIAVCIDAYYSVGTFIPYYTIAVCAALILIEWVKPRVSLYNGDS